MLWITPEGAKLVARVLEGRRVNDTYWAEKITPALARVLHQKLVKVSLHDAVTNQLFASYIGEGRPGEHLIRLSDGTATGEEDILRKHFDLTAREAEVLLWITQGKSNRDVAEILSCSPRTVNKHLEQIFHKLHVENRTAAGTVAVRALTNG